MKDYADYMTPRFQQATIALQGLGEQSAIAARDPSVIGTQDWVLRTATALAFIKNAGEEMQRYQNPPSDVRNLHPLVAQIGGDLVYVADEFALGVDQRSGEHLTNASRRLQTAEERLNRANAELTRILRTYGL